MESEIEQIGMILLDAPVGYVEQTISKIIEKPVYLKVVEQNPISGTNYQRKVVIGHDKFPILRAMVMFDSKNIPNSIMTALLQKKESIGKILRNNEIMAQRRPITVDVDYDQKTVTRKYDIAYNGLVWFQVLEEIRLDLLSACKYS